MVALLPVGFGLDIVLLLLCVPRTIVALWGGTQETAAPNPPPYPVMVPVVTQSPGASGVDDGETACVKDGQRFVSIPIHEVEMGVVDERDQSPSRRNQNNALGVVTGDTQPTVDTPTGPDRPTKDGGREEPSCWDRPSCLMYSVSCKH